MFTLAVAALATSALAQTAPALTPAEVDQAIRGKDQPLLLVDAGRAWGNAIAIGLNGPNAQTSGTGFSLRVYTPQTWITHRAAEAKRLYLPFTAADVTEDDLAPVLRVMVFPDTPTRLTGPDMAAAQSADHVVLRDEQKTLVVQPLGITPFEQSLSSALRDRVYAGVTATFDLLALDALRQANKEFLVVVVGEHGERTFKIKTKHFERLPYRLDGGAMQTASR